MKHEFDTEDIYSGSLCQIKKPGGLVFWHLTWKKDNRTVTRYVRLDEVPKIKKGLKAYKKAKKDLQRIAASNLTKLMAGRKNDH